MKDSYNLYQSQYKKAKEALEILEEHRAEINLKLESDASSALLHKELRTVNMDIRITLNEIEHAASCIQDCESKYNTSLN
jgi:flagellar biosynthesis chaperone FliJ